MLSLNNKIWTRLATPIKNLGFSPNPFYCYTNKNLKNWVIFGDDEEEEEAAAAAAAAMVIKVALR